MVKKKKKKSLIPLLKYIQKEKTKLNGYGDNQKRLDLKRKIVTFLLN